MTPQLPTPDAKDRQIACALVKADGKLRVDMATYKHLKLCNCNVDV